MGMRSISRPSRSLTPWLPLALLGCSADELPSGNASGGHGSGSSTGEATASVSATGMLPPATTSSSSGSSSSGSSSSGDAAESTASTTRESSSGAAADSSTTSDPVSGCDGAQCCGNGTINGTEQCDCGGLPCTPEGLDFAECAGLVNPMFPNRVYTGGLLDCSPASCQYVFTVCTFCGDGDVNGNEACEPDPPPQDTCASLGLGDATDPLPCDASCQLDTSSCV